MIRFAPSVIPMTCEALPVLETSRPKLLSRALLLRFVSIVGSSIGFYLPLSVVPMFAKETGSESGAGLATVALLLATVACELVTPRLIARVGYRWALAVGLILLGAPTALLMFCDSAWMIVGVSVVRGAGFAVAVVAGGAVTAALIPAGRRGEGLALVGLVGGIPGLLSLPAGVWAATHWGYAPVFAVTAAATLLALLSVPGLPHRDATTKSGGHHGVLAALRNPVLTRPATVFAAASVAIGVFVTFLPLALTGQPSWVAAAALLAQPAASTLSRLVAGKLGDKCGPAKLIGPGLVVAVAGMTTLAVTGSPSMVIGGALVFGAGFGALQNATLVLMYARVPAGGEGAVSAIWNAAYDLGMAGGALGAGLLVSPIGYPATFALAALLMVPALAVVRRDRCAPDHIRE